MGKNRPTPEAEKEKIVKLTPEQRSQLSSSEKAALKKEIHKKKMSLLAAAICAFAFAATVLADQPAPALAPAMHPKLAIINGEVISINTAAKQIVLKNDIVFNVADKANIRKEGKVITLSDIKTGDMLLIAFRQQGEKKLATAIKVRPPKTVKN